MHRARATSARFVSAAVSGSAAIQRCAAAKCPRFTQ